jgi:hypothetical protein
VRKLAYLTILVVVGAIALSLAQSALANQVLPCGDPTLNTYNAVTGVPQSTFNLNELVNITAYSAYDYAILVLRPDSTSFMIYNTTAGPTTLFTGGATYTAVRSDLSNELGTWDLVLGDTHVDFVVAYVHVIPFAPLGVVGILGACFVGAGLKLRKRK